MVSFFYVYTYSYNNVNQKLYLTYAFKNPKNKKTFKNINSKIKH